MSPPSLGLPEAIEACLFDLDGVLAKTASLHAAAWKATFDPFLRDQAERTRTRFVPFDPVVDYVEFLDGRTRHDGIRTFLASRGLRLPEGAPGDGPAHATVQSLGDAKNARALQEVRAHGVEAFAGSVRYVEAVRAAGMRYAVVSASENCDAVLAAAGIGALFDVRVDGVVARRDSLRGKPAPDMYLAAAQALDVTPAGAAVFEDALAGVDAARAGGFGYVVGVDRGGRAERLLTHGADRVVPDLADLIEP